jgi:hypothetical protein
MEYPEYPGFTRIICLTKSSAWGDLGPYVLKDDQGRLMENIWQFSKVYESVPKVSIPFSFRHRVIVWEWPAEKHLNADGEPNDAYWKWRDAGMKNAEPVRYPVGMHHRRNCKFALKEKSGAHLDYISSRKQIYLPVFVELVKKAPRFKKLQDRLKKGENLLIVEVDGPHQESMPYYKEKYAVADDWIDQDSILVTKESMKTMINDSKHNFGHGYCLAIALSDWDLNDVTELNQNNANNNTNVANNTNVVQES